MTATEDPFALDSDQWPDLTPIVAALLRNPLLTEESAPQLYRLARAHEEQLRNWFRSTTGWHVTISAFGRYVRLFKRRDQPPSDRRVLPYGDRQPVLVLTLLCLIAEQLWRHPQITYGDLQREVIRTCATDAHSSHLPLFDPVAQPGGSRAKADVHRRAFKDALLTLQEWRVITADSPLMRAENEVRADLVLTCDPDRLNDLLAVPAISQQPIDMTRPETHVAALCADQADLPDHASRTQRDLQRRHRALRCVLDDAVVNLTADSDAAGYLASPAGRRRALDAALAAGLTCVVRRDLWLTADPAGDSTDLDFPQPRTIAGQATLLIAEGLTHRGASQVVSREDCHTRIVEATTAHPEWARSIRSGASLRALTNDALRTLVAAGVLAATVPPSRAWVTAPAIGFWRVRVNASPQEPPAPPPDSALFEESDDE